MRHYNVLAVFGIASLAAAVVWADDDWSPLFDGEALNGWIQRNGTATYRVEDGAIVGKTAEGSQNSFLCTEKDYADFELKFEVMVDPKLNSGVQIRSLSKADFEEGRVHGPQVEIEAGPGAAGYVYSEATGRGWLSEDRAKQTTLKPDEWNEYRVVAEGPRIKTWLNGEAVTDITDEQSPRSGFIGLQVHSIPAGEGPYEVRWRNIAIREIDLTKGE
jgi:hypothetical protein